MTLQQSAWMVLRQVERRTRTPFRWHGLPSRDTRKIIHIRITDQPDEMDLDIAAQAVVLDQISLECSTLMVSIGCGTCCFLKMPWVVEPWEI